MATYLKKAQGIAVSHNFVSETSPIYDTLELDLPSAGSTETDHWR
jgi:hypothetical protein